LKSGGVVKVTKEKIENSQAFLTVEMEPAEMEGPLEDAYRRLAKKTNIPGFRKGKAPRAILERYIGKESVLEDALSQLIPQAYEKAIKEQEIEPFAQPDIEITQTDPVIFKAIVPLPPTIELGDYKSIRVTPEPVEVTEENVSAVLEELRHQNGTWEPVERPLDFGDLAVLNITSEVDELPFIKKLGINYLVLRESVAVVPGFSEKVVGMNKGEEKDFKLTLPEDFSQSEFAGKEASFKVKLEEIKEEKLPEMDDEFVKHISNELTTVAELREEVATNMKLRAEERARLDFEGQIISAVIDRSQVDYPPVLVEMEINGLINEQTKQLQVVGRSLEDYLKSINKTEEQLREELRPLAAKNITTSFLLGKVAEAERIELSDSEIDAEVEKMLQNTAEDKREEVQKLLNTPQARESVRQPLMVRKTVERLVEIAESPDITQTEAKEENK
jgi:trigger factor